MSELDMVAVIAESRERATQQRDASEDFLASAALKAIVEGEDVRAVARLCGFDPGEEVTRTEDADPIRSASILFSLYGYGGGARQTGLDAFADWLSEKLAARIREQA